nr:MAG TPA: TRI9 protein [Caudoviricetes sp.]
MPGEWLLLDISSRTLLAWHEVCAYPHVSWLVLLRR